MRRLVPVVLLLALALPALSQPATDRDLLFQRSTLDALLCGLYQGTLSVADLLAQGDFGLGTFDSLDGEMVVLDGTCYRVAASGAVDVVGTQESTPFAQVTFFDPDQPVMFEQDMDLAGLIRLLDGVLPSPNLPYAIRMDGRFPYLKTRSVPRQTPPFGPLAQVVAHQTTFELRDVEGTLVGFRMPAFVAGLNLPGYHFHFLTADRTAGGHVLDFRSQARLVTVDITPRYMVSLPDTPEFLQAVLPPQRGAHGSGTE